MIYIEVCPANRQKIKKSLYLQSRPQIGKRIQEIIRQTDGGSIYVPNFLVPAACQPSH